MVSPHSVPEKIIKHLTFDKVKLNKMNAASVKIDNKKYRIISEEDYLTLMKDINDLKKVFKRRGETGIEARDFFKKIENKSKTTL